MALGLRNKVVTYLKQHPEQKFTAGEIAEAIFKEYPEECREKQERSKATLNPLDSEAKLVQQIVAEIGAQRKALQKNDPEVKTTEGRPRKYYFTESTDSAEIEHSESTEALPASSLNGPSLQEADLYPLLSEFLLSEGIYSKRIDEKRSTNSHGLKGNHWLYPDLVGMENLSQDWEREIKDCVQQYSDKKTKLWSFEVKRSIDRSTVRGAFFQAVSNSSWANFGYLVACELQSERGDSTLKELRMLSSLHGIGFILLDAENPSESQIMIPAKERNEINWDTANRLTEENTDFRKYIELIRKFYQTGDIRPDDWYMSADQD